MKKRLNNSIFKLTAVKFLSLQFINELAWQYVTALNLICSLHEELQERYLKWYVFVLALRLALHRLFGKNKIKFGQKF